MEAFFEFASKNTSIATTIIGVIGIIVPAIISAFVSHMTVIGDTKRLREQWEVEDRRAEDKEFSDMVAAVSTCGTDPTREEISNAASCVARVMVKATDELEMALGELYTILHESYHCYSVDVALRKAIAARQKQSSTEKPKHHHAPRNKKVTK